MEIETESGRTLPNDSGLSPYEVAVLKARLLAERASIGRRQAVRRHALASGPTREIDDADWASDSADQGLLARLIDRDAKLLHEVEAALRRMAVGTFGVCTLSGEPIGFERLQARPWARHALAAKEGVERDRVEEPSFVVVPGDASDHGDDDQAA
jgi:DnaK suppressor protein